MDERGYPGRRPGGGKVTDPNMDRETNPDLELARRAAAGDEAAWRAIYVATRERLFSLLAYQLGNRQEAMDVLQDTYVSAIRSIGRYRGEGSLEAWMAGIAFHQAQSWKRRFLMKRKRTDSMPEGLDPAAPSRRLRAALEQLSERQRRAVLLHEWMGYSFAEVASILGTSEATARVHAFRGRDTLRALLGDACAPDPAASLMEQRS
jgi:RNA polymerase sigma factor (sigma-70 family)